ncbi:MAG: chemotaxis protein CheA, partial [Proteobacteria bacterium]|nr:chemotaxis protein CheA [Pseudomonadota bacterium]
NRFIRDLPQDSHNAGLERGLEEITQLTRELQESVMSIRAQPVKTVFSRMSRVVRELAQQTGKKLKLELVGEGTEVDKTVTERLSDPLTHMVRNAADHGIESPEERIAAGKPAEGTIRLSAEHKGGRIVIQLTDDGKGINRERVLQRARERGLVDEHSQLSDEEIDNLIFLPGFSTAETISNISGRGVGMDVVRRNVQDLGGRVSIKSNPGKGSAFQLTLPLTLAVMDGMVVRVGDETYIVPLSNIVECLRPAAGDVDATGVDGDVLMLRGEVVPLAYLHAYFNVPGAQQDCTKGVVVVLEVEGGAKIGLVVDDLRGQQQVVIKSLEVNYGRVDGVAAATILGNVQVALILDVAAFGRLFQSGRSSSGSSSDRNHSQAAVA